MWRHPWHQQQTGRQQTICQGRPTICISTCGGMQETESGMLTRFLTGTRCVRVGIVSLLTAVHPL